MQSVLVIFSFLPFLLVSAYEGYFWRDFSGRIPPDAVPGGKDASGKETYIGQTYIHNVGLIVIQIFPGNSNPNVAAYGVKKASEFKKILCSKYQEKFYWLPTTSKTFHLDATGKHAVIGGFDHVDANKGMLHIGRLSYQGEIRIGHISGYALENAMFMFMGGPSEQKATSYEVLMFDVSDQDFANRNYTAVCTY